MRKPKDISFEKPGDVIQIDKVAQAEGETLSLPAVLFVDGDTVTADADSLAKVTVTAEVLVVELDDCRIHDFDANDVGGSGELLVGRPLVLRAAAERRPIGR